MDKKHTHIYFCIRQQLTFIAFFLFFITHLQAETIGLYYNSKYVHIKENNLFAEGSTLHKVLETQGHDIITFEDFSTTTFLDVISKVNVIVIPELEKRSLLRDTPEEVKEALKNYVDCGGGLVILGVVSSSSIQNNNAVSLLNEAFDFSIERTTIELSGTALLDGNIITNTPFETAPTTLPDNSANAYLSANSLPDGSLSLYYQAGNKDMTSVALIPYGRGKIIYLGWSWWNAAPVGDLDGGWTALLDKSIESLTLSS